MAKPRIDPTKVPAAADAYREACMHMLHCWDALHEAEKLIGRELLTDNVVDLCGQLDTPDSVMRISDDDFLEIAEKGVAL